MEKLVEYLMCKTYGFHLCSIKHAMKQKIKKLCPMYEANVYTRIYLGFSTQLRFHNRIGYGTNLLVNPENLTNRIKLLTDSKMKIVKIKNEFIFGIEQLPPADSCT